MERIEIESDSYHLKAAKPFTVAYFNDEGKFTEFSINPNHSEQFKRFAKTLIWATNKGVELRIRAVA